ncbi:efflux RND transporter periplasmic adaptor subunit [Paenibacillus albiflavus]|uniref:Efflux RND transporter periplasmic adaptor subunit n=1 Tax=Paenibacillus albiflavus TaxID=2545760 RepID=A0A4V2WP96_9BACL|nr:efflux RND transporter periplasmic adaptor subunit [Paenibacillus albiflavus]TCZ78462.1 efflux RND transporter periplasmic adaptor subunit [Paenibacillus albiflavus]
MFQRRQRLASILFVTFFVILGGLTLFSNTFQTAMLPKVTTEKPSMKTLDRRIQGNGVLQPREQVELTSEGGSEVTKVHVELHEEVKKGQNLVTFDTTDAQQQVLDAEADLKKRYLNQEVLQEQCIVAYQSGDADALRKAKRDLEIDQLDLDIAKRKLDKLRKDVTKKGTIIAPFDGIIAKVEAKIGMIPSQGQALVTVVQRDAGYQFSFAIEEGAANLLQLDEEVSVLVKGSSDQRLKGRIVEIQDATTSASDQSGGALSRASSEGETAGAAKKTVVVAVSGDKLHSGEKASVNLEKKTSDPGLVINKHIVKKDGTGSFVLVVDMNQSTLGNTYTVRKAYISTGDENADEIIVLKGLTTRDDIIAESSEPLQEGNRIRLQ